MKAIKKISVVGAGAIGTMFGGLIQHFHPELEVILIARGLENQHDVDFWSHDEVVHHFSQLRRT